MLISRFHPLWHLILVFETEANTYNLNYLNAIPCLKPDETGFMFDCCSVRFSNVRLCSIGKILWLCSIVKILGWVWLSSIEVNRTIEVRLPIFRLVTLSNVVWAEKKADTNAEKDRANRGHAQLKPSLPSFSLYSKVLMSITLLRFKFQNATKFGNYLRFSIFFLGLLKISRRRREVQWQNWGDILVMLADLLLKFHKTVMVI